MLSHPRKLREKGCMIRCSRVMLKLVLNWNSQRLNVLVECRPRKDRASRKPRGPTGYGALVVQGRRTSKGPP
ncbi:hypothetical protein M569_17197 [Genlisea aurea]|uniref:Uncharacterized protein n=1 Tax=Genlisea aurea TaxID=192259 RepID=S8BSQ5_9LAMI|nr:hypothetical protein M569_17197 [Genlisea aurea]